ncbi:hypothetical protein HMPREF0973_02511 [Prevotella veroralis F0319]|uniref:Uncharacterized protein n=1 Tax=Prevotella veroralis F0319 TaxID=649761 RepID=C9MS97_9BACT|nr:hypothetical protein HMPREF0973_02511 [Prevotella veroralis F0319]
MSWLVPKLLVLLNVVPRVGTDEGVCPLIYPFVSSLQTTSPPLEGLEGALVGCIPVDRRGRLSLLCYLFYSGVNC